MGKTLKHEVVVAKLPLIPIWLFEETQTLDFERPEQYYRSAYRLF